MPIKVAYQATIEYMQILDEQGGLDAKLARDTLTDDQVVMLYEHMSMCRRLDEIAFKLQRSGRLGTYPQNMGQEAIASVALAARPQDWMVPCYRENAALYLHGLPPEMILLHWMGDERGNQIPEGLNITPMSIPIGSHMLHAAGIGWAARIRGDDQVAFTFFGDGATSEGDFHEACNFAGVMHAPVVFICQNNQWAISTPRSKQTRSETFAQKGIAYGLKVRQVDGNDIFAIFRAAREAVADALKGQPTMIETLTYRLGDHTTADDARRYRDPAELEAARKRDPLIRTRKYLESKDLWSADQEEAMIERNKAQVDDIVARATNIEKPKTTDIFDAMFATIPPELARQRDTMQTNSLGQFPQQETLRRGATAHSPTQSPAHA
ncbi:MAG: pyruvate dehydrogenase (acetyl-transferring) E1 component subunit alpha [Phycisphaeraceae bacterium]|nr:pyruvate dehydrogenase (acetyl-transferring) E1 component subunit alpha [Phycisphaeraceae bacterium]MCB9848063.1 pyruvate dehydrogenase (acetyl-transferring) E1 component subunit alpha [Phycisphaeraceae bacterium]